MSAADYVTPPRRDLGSDELPPEERIAALRADMLIAAEQLEFERAAELRDQVAALQKQVSSSPSATSGSGGKAGTKQQGRGKKGASKGAGKRSSRAARK